jgi:hypothetical protein
VGELVGQSVGWGAGGRWHGWESEGEFDVVRAAIAHLAAHPPALDDVLGRAKAAKTERDRRRLGK